jgi:ankyrin repeat protein
MRDLCLACAQGRRDLVLAFLHLGTPVNAYCSEDGVVFETPLHAAARSGQLELVELLLSRGAKPTLPIRLLVPDPAKSLDRAIYVERQSESGCRARHLAGRAGYRELAELLAKAEWMNILREPLVRN